MNDTTPEMEKLYRRLMKEKTGEERFLMGVSMCATARRIVKSSLPEGLSEREIRQQLFLRYYGHEFTAEQTEKILNAL